MAGTGPSAEGTIPIMGWAGPSDGMIRPDVMRGMADAGFTVSHSSVSGGADAVLRALDVAAEAGVPLLLVHQVWHVGDDFVLDDARKREIEALVSAVRGHPGLYGYHLRDEPRYALLPSSPKSKVSYAASMTDTSCTSTISRPSRGGARPRPRHFSGATSMAHRDKTPGTHCVNCRHGQSNPVS